MLQIVIDYDGGQVVFVFDVGLELFVGLGQGLCEVVQFVGYFVFEEYFEVGCCGVVVCMQVGDIVDVVGLVVGV